MRISNGVDMVQVSRLEEAFARQGKALLERFMTNNELGDCRLSEEKFCLNRAAARYAAKEAMAKALGTGIAKGVHLRDIEILKDEKCAPFYRLHGETLARFEREGYTGAALSISHDGDYAIAFCTIWGDQAE